MKAYSQDPLLNARQKIALYSFNRSKKRIAKQRQMIDSHDEIQLQQLFENKLKQQLQYNSISTQYGDTSSTTRVTFSRCGKYCGTAGSSGVCTIWNTQDQKSIDFCTQNSILKGQSKVCDIDFHPKIGNIPGFAPNIVTGNTLGEIQLWTFDKSLQEQKKINIKAHSDRVNSVRFHQDGSLFISASYDKTWSIFDAMKLKQISNQRGHQSQIHALDIHPDGALICTCDLDRYGMCWDLRTGKGIYELEADNSITCCCFHPNGYQIAVGGKSNLIDIFDLRRRKKLKSLPAHCKVISDLKYNEEGTILFSSSHDNKVKLWHGLNYIYLDEQLEHCAKITSISLSQSKLAVSMIDKKWTMWSCSKNSQNQVKNQI